MESTLTRGGLLAGIAALVAARTEERGPEICNMDEIRDGVFAMHSDVRRRLDDIERQLGDIQSALGMPAPGGSGDQPETDAAMTSDDDTEIVMAGSAVIEDGQTVSCP